jgi:DNA-binding transcriptional MerR regulator
VISDAKGKFRIQAVADMTGVPAATLRAWERRYGVPVPERTESAYRLYTEQDVELIRRLRELTEAGMAPAEAARLVQRVAEADVAVDPSEDPFAVAREAILEAVEDFDPTRLELSVRRTMFLGSAPTVFDQVLTPVMRTVGDRWHAGLLSVGQEHMATEVLGSAARDMLRLVVPEEGAPVAVLGCFADEEHALPLYGVAFRLAQWGFRPVILGARTPPVAIRHAVERLQPALVGLSITVPPPAYRARELVNEYADACGQSGWMCGGAATLDLAALIQASGGIVVQGTDVRSLRAAVESLVPKTRKRSEALADAFEPRRDHEFADGPDGEHADVDAGGHAAPLPGATSVKLLSDEESSR